MISPLKSLLLPPISRGTDMNTYYPTEDGLLIQYDFDRYLRNYIHVNVKQRARFYHIIVINLIKINNYIHVYCKFPCVFHA